MPIGMTPDQYYEAFVIGNYEDYKNNPGCLRRAFNAAVSASQMVDHYFQYYRRHNPSKINHFNKIGDFISHISNKINGYFKDIRSTANAYKYLYTGANPRYKQYSSISSMGTIETIQLTSGTIQELHEEYLNGEDSKIVYTTKTGEQFDFLPALNSVVEFWKNEFA